MLDFDLSFYFRVIRKWFWLVILAGAIGGGLTYYVLDQQPEEYSARILVAVGNTLIDPDPEIQDIRIGQELVETYAQLVNIPSTLQPVIDELGLEATVADLQRNIEAIPIVDTSLFEVIVIWSEAQTAADIANAIGDQLLVNNPSSLSPSLQNQIDLSQSQIDLLTEQIEELRNQLDTIDERLEATEDPAERDALNTQRNNLIGQINDSTANIAQLSATITRIEQSANVLVIQQSALPSGSPISRNTTLFTGVAAFGLAMIASGVVILIEAVDTSYRNPKQIENTLKLPVRGTVSVGSRPNLSKGMKDVKALEQYQILRTNLIYVHEEDQRPAYIFSSPTQGEQKETIIANLAMAAADTGSRVLLVDADMRQARMTSLLRLPNERGLVDFLEAAPDNIDETRRSDMLASLIQETEIDGLHIITPGSTQVNAIRLLESPIMLRWWNVLLNELDYDLILVNTPPLQLYPDTATLVVQTGIELLLVLENAKSRPEEARSALDRFRQIGGKVNGVIFGQ